MGCRKDDPSPAEQLPPATQTGANTIGCLVNGQPWVPAGNNGSSNYAISYDPNPYGVFDLATYRYPVPSGKTFQSLKIYLRELHQVRSYDLKNLTLTRVSWNDSGIWSDMNSDEPNTYHKGTVTVTRLDLQAGIISGTFEFTLAKPGFDTVRVTNGRFDKRL